MTVCVRIPNLCTHKSRHSNIYSDLLWLLQIFAEIEDPTVPITNDIAAILRYLMILFCIDCLPVNGLRSPYRIVCKQKLPVVAWNLYVNNTLE